MFLRKKQKSRKMNKSRISKINPTIFILTLIFILFVGSFIYEIKLGDDSTKRHPNLGNLLKKNSYEKETGHRINLEIKNGCGQKNIAFMYKNFLREEGFDVMDTKNAKSFDHDFSKVLLHRGDIQMAHNLSNLMGINDSLIKINHNDNLMLDLTLIIGKDFNQLSSYDNASIHYPTY